MSWHSPILPPEVAVDDRAVLIVDDDPSVRQLIADTLTGAGYVCQTAVNGAEALQRLADRETALVLSDIRMPALDGLELLDQVRVHHPNTFVILLTGEADVPIVIQALRSGAADFLTKPFTVSDLIERVENALDRRQSAVRERALLDAGMHESAVMEQRYSAMTASIVEALGEVLATRHPETQAHSARVAHRAADLAATLQLPEDEVKALFVAGLLHDMGKIAIDARVLEKPGGLTSDERDILRSHPLSSAKIATPVALSGATVDAIRHHHENFDGSGYPDRLAGEDIPFVARILAVCDAFDAMTSERAYQSAIDADEGYSRLRAGSGTQWDPDVVEAFCRLDGAVR